jgi:glycine reductase
LSVGANRVVPGISIPHPVGMPSLSANEEIIARKRILQTALDALITDIGEQTLFPIKQDA